MKKGSTTPNPKFTNVAHELLEYNIRTNATGGKTLNQIFIGTFQLHVLHYWEI